ncbi:hypothetical protein ACJX0J_030207, partial [Zea mays]
MLGLSKGLKSSIIYTDRLAVARAARVLLLILRVVDYGIDILAEVHPFIILVPKNYYYKTSITAVRCGLDLSPISLKNRKHDEKSSNEEITSHFFGYGCFFPPASFLPIFSMSNVLTTLLSSKQASEYLFMSNAHAVLGVSSASASLIQHLLSLHPQLFIITFVLPINSLTPASLVCLTVSHVCPSFVVGVIHIHFYLENMYLVYMYSCLNILKSNIVAYSVMGPHFWVSLLR